jgi:hypothetical protein
MRDDQQITADGAELIQQAEATAQSYMKAARDDIDAMFGKGMAYKHPELVVAYMYTCAADLDAAILAQQLRSGLHDLSEAIREVTGVSQLNDNPNSNAADTHVSISDILHGYARAQQKFRQEPE